MEVIANPIPTHKLECPASFNRDAFRNSLDLEPSDLVCVFCALGHFERKGLPLLLQALRSPALSPVKLVVVGGEPDLVKAYGARASRSGVESKIRFVGFQKYAQPYLWSADAFILPSAYETFSLAAYEAAAAGLPVIAPALHGICDLLVDGKTGFVIEANVASITLALERLLQISPAERLQIGACAKEAASSYSVERFIESWRSLYRRWPLYAAQLSHSTSTQTSPAAARRGKTWLGPEHEL
jgi:glycosyltransferase involved in cell wall biosynthesis